MEMSAKLTTKKISSAKPGELVKVFANKNEVFAIVLDVNNLHAMVGILPSGAVPSASYDRIGLNTTCLSFGNETVIEPLWGEETRPGNTKHQADHGTLFIAGSKAVVGFQPAANDINNMGDVEVYFDLIDNKFEDTYPRELAAPVRNWNIWESKEARNKPNLKPLVEVRLP